MRKSHFHIDTSDEEEEAEEVLISDNRNSKRPRCDNDATNRSTNDVAVSSVTLECQYNAPSLNTTTTTAANDPHRNRQTSLTKLALADIDMDDATRNTLRLAYEQPVHTSALLYAAANAPTSCSPFTRPWIYLYNYSLITPTDDAYVGKWMWFVSPAHVDDAFLAVAAALDTCHLGSTVKAPPATLADRVVPIIVYTNDYRDQEDVLRIGLVLQSLLPYPRTISYKPDVFTLDDGGIHGTNTLKYKVIYQLKPEARELTLVANGKALDCALQMSSQCRNP